MKVWWKISEIVSGLLLITAMHELVSGVNSFIVNEHVRQQVCQLLFRMGGQRGIGVLLVPTPAELAVSVAQQGALSFAAQISGHDATQAARLKIGVDG